MALTVPLRDRALSVSGGYPRFFEKDGVTYSHIMDPRTGRPVQGLLSVAVLSDRATDGDALDNVLFVQGPEAARAALARLPATEALFFLPRPGRSGRSCAPAAGRSFAGVQELRHGVHRPSATPAVCGIGLEA